MSLGIHPLDKFRMTKDKKMKLTRKNIFDASYGVAYALDECDLPDDIVMKLREVDKILNMLSLDDIVDVEMGKYVLGKTEDEGVIEAHGEIIEKYIKSLSKRDRLNYYIEDADTANNNIIKIAKELL